jgi:hypothetical protein
MLPDSIPLSLWQEFRKMRKKKRAPLTEYAETLILCKLEKWRVEVGANPIDVLNESIEKGWSGVFLNGHGQPTVNAGVRREASSLAGKDCPPTFCCICKRPLNGSFIYCSGGKRCHDC